MLKPPTLIDGARVGVVTPSRKVDEQALRKGCALIETWGLKVELGKHVVSAENKYLSAADEARLTDLQQMLDREDIDAIFCARGGYGMTRIVDHLNFDQLKRKPKWIVGFSDITALHLRLEREGIESIHGCMPVQYSKEQYKDSIESLRKILFGQESENIKANYDLQNQMGEAHGRVIGGNLSLIVDAIGTTSSPEGKGKILILEEIDEPLYKIDRMLTQMKRVGLFEDLAGLVIGHMTDLTDTDLPFGQSVRDLILDKISTRTFPVAFGFPIGHEAPNMAWRHGGIASLRVDEEGSNLDFSY
ncbi:MAG: LD-carboxypeptidase [Cyclobacteriaceae bacterium]